MNSTLTEDNQYSRFAFRNFEKIHILVFYSARDKSSLEYADLVQKLESGLQPDQVFAFAYADVETYPSSIGQFNLVQLPQVIVASNPEVIEQERLSVSPTALFIQIQKFKQPFLDGFKAEKQLYMEKCQTIVENSPMVVFIKGTPEQPKCKFTRALLGELKTLNLKFHFYDIDNDQGMRQWLKYYSNWKTFPQVFAQGKLIGGLDVTIDLIKKGQFLDKLPKEVILADLSSLGEVQKLGERLILHYDQPNPEDPLAQFMRNKNLDYQFYNILLNETLLKQLDARGYKGKSLLLVNNKVYDIDQVQRLNFQ